MDDPVQTGKVDLLSTRNIDFHQRRIVNAHPSVDDYDYVVRKELKLLGAAKEGTAAGGGLGFDKCVFGVGIGANIVTGTNVCPIFPVLYHRTQLELIGSTIKTAPTGSDIIFVLKRNGAEIGTYHWPDGATSVQTYFTFSMIEYAYLDTITIDITQVGSSIAGRELYVGMRFRIIEV